MRFVSLPICFSAFLAIQVDAWGAIGHQLTGAIAQELISNKTFQQVSLLLPATWNGDLSKAATWADEVKSQSKYSWASSLHFVNPKDNPPEECSWDEQRDCPGGKCIVGAIRNFTQQVGCYARDGNTEQKSEALKFLVHFFGDIAQPLHDCGRLKGGNDAKAKFDGKSSNLHSIWDTSMITKRMGIAHKNDFNTYADYLVKEINTGKWSQSKNSWLGCAADEPFAKWSVCPGNWALEGDAYNCETMWADYDANPSADLSKAYYEKHLPLVEVQLAKAGYRLAQSLDKIFASC